MQTTEDILKPKRRSKNRHTVIIWFTYGLEDDSPFYNLSMELAEFFEGSNAGWYDGHEIAMDNTDGGYFLYGPNAETLFKAALPIIEKYPFMKGAVASLWFGEIESNASMIEIEV